MELVWSQEFESRDDAWLAEFRIKKWSGAKKEALVAGNWEDLQRKAKKKDWAGYRQRKAGA